MLLSRVPVVCVRDAWRERAFERASVCEWTDCNAHIRYVCHTARSYVRPSVRSAFLASLSSSVISVSTEQE